MRRSLVQRTGLAALTAAVTVLGVSCACVPFNPPTGDATTTTVGTDGSTTTTAPTSTTASTTTTTDPYGSTTTTAPSSGNVVDVDDVAVDDCITPTDDDTFVDDVEIVPCDQPHDFEVFAIYDIDNTGDYPGNTKLIRDAYKDCQTYFEDYVGIAFEDSVYDITTITPAPSTWVDGDRAVVCLVTDIDGDPLTTAVKDSGL